MGYMIYLNETPQGLCDTLELAQHFALKYVGQGDRVHIKSLAAPAPSQFWYYHDADKGWTTSSTPR